MIHGGCFCGKIRYEIEEGAYPAGNCHCTICRRLHAAAYVTWLVVGREQFRYVDEGPTPLESSPHGTRYFCSSCGTQIACVTTASPDIVDVAVGTLDTPERFPPQGAVFEDTRLPWVHDR